MKRKGVIESGYLEDVSEVSEGVFCHQVACDLYYS